MFLGFRTQQWRPGAGRRVVFPIRFEQALAGVMRKVKQAPGRDHLACDCPGQRLLRYGFERLPVLGEDGELEALIFLRDWRGWREVVLIYSEDEARAYRCGRRLG